MSVKKNLGMVSCKQVTKIYMNILGKSLILCIHAIPWQTCINNKDKTTNLGPLHMCNSCVAWSICGTPNNGSRAVPVLWLALGNYSSCWIALLSLNTGGRCLVLGQLDMPQFAGAHGRPVPFWANVEEGSIEGGRKGRSGWRGGRGGYGQSVKWMN